MLLFYLTSVILISVTTVQTEEVCTVTGTVTDPHCNPLMGATVMVVGTSLGAMTDTNGVFFISNVPFLDFTCLARMGRLGESIRSVQASSGDTVEVNFFLPPDIHHPSERPFMTLDSQLSGTVFTDTLEIVIGNWQDLDVACSQIWEESELLPSWQINDSTICVAAPQDTDTLQLFVFPAEDTAIAIPSGPCRIRVNCRIDMPAEHAPETQYFQQEYSFIDLTAWGNSTFKNWGLLGSELIYAENDQPEILLVYHEQAVLIDNMGDSRVIEFPFPTLKYICDSQLNYILIWDIYGQNGTSGNVALVELETGSWSIFDPTPAIQEPDGHYYTVSSATVIPPFWGVKHYVTSSGAVIIVEEEFFRTFDKTGSLMCNVSFEEIGIDHFYYTDQFLSLDETAFSALFTDGTGNYCVTIDLQGNILNISPLPLVQLAGNIGEEAADPATAVLWKSMDLYGLARIDCLTGDCIYRPALRIFNMFTSRDHSLLGVTIFSTCNPGYTVLETWDMDTGERLSSRYETYYNPDAVLFGVRSITDDGHFFGITSPQPGSDVDIDAYIMNDSGQVIWRSSSAFRQFLRQGYSMFDRRNPGPQSSLSPGGTTMTLTYGRYLMLVHFNEEDPAQ